MKPYRFEVTETPVAKVVVMRLRPAPGKEWMEAALYGQKLRVRVWLEDAP